MEKQNKCKICGWIGTRTHFHHIIPRKLKGTETDKNLIELCPNCHSIACEDEEKFAIKNNLIGEKISMEENEALIEAGLIHCKLINEGFYNNLELYLKLLHLEKKFNFDKYDYIAEMMGVTRDSILRYGD